MKRTWILTTLSVVSCLIGCTPDGPPLGTVKGKVTLDGQPVPNVVLTFIPEGGSPSYGKTNRQGEYELMFTDTKKGAMVGGHRVELESKRISKDELAEMKASGLDVPDESIAITKKHLPPDGLKAEVKKGSNQVDFPLKTNP